MDKLLRIVKIIMSKKYFQIRFPTFHIFFFSLCIFFCSNYCEANQIKPLSQADFGKVMKQVYPRVRARRLGTRGNSRYCYSGLRRSVKLRPPVLPDLSEKPTVK